MLIDGHNLIGAGVFPDIRLEDEDDELKLIARLRIWRSRYHDRMTVVFDRGIPGGYDAKLSGAGIEVVFAADPVQADDLIRRRLMRDGRNLTLVTNDDALLREARVRGVETLRGVEFVRRYQAKSPRVAEAEAGTEVEPPVDAAEVEHWLREFGAAAQKRAKSTRPPNTNGAQKGKRR
jgi:predicted RNA-binding protein with PIN domain